MRNDERQMTSVWTITDGKAGDEGQCLAVAGALGLVAETRRVSPRAPWAWAMPWGPVDPREAPGREGGPLAGPFPDLAIGSGRRAVPYLRALKLASRGHTFTVCLKDPRTGTRAADLIWVASHDRLRGDNVIVTLTPPHRVSAAVLAAARTHPDPRLAGVQAPRVAVLAGGDSRHHRFTQADLARLLAQLGQLADRGAGLMITASRRTPPDLAQGLAELAARTGGFFWDGSGENPYAAMLALADAVVVTADSTNMLGEAAASGAPVLVFSPSGGHAKIDALIAGLVVAGIAHPFTGELTGARYRPVDATPVIAQGIAKALRARGIAL